MTIQKMPLLGLGTYGRTGADGEAAILAGIEIGYRHLDTAQSYGTEPVIGRAWPKSGVPRGELFLTTKVASVHLARADFLPSLERSRDNLGVDEIDLTLIHWPHLAGEIPFEHYIEDLATARARGLTRLIGVSNFTIAHLEAAEAILGSGQLATNQVEIHPYLQNRRLVDHCRAAGITPTAYVPLAKGRVAGDPVLSRIGDRHGADASQVALAWLMGEGIAVIPSSARADRMRSNFAARSIVLSDNDRAEIAGLDRGDRIIAPADGPAWD